MTNVSVAALRANFERALLDEGWQWDSFVDDASEVAVFGSQACGLADAVSDWDVLLVGPSHREGRGKLEIISVPDRRVLSSVWRGTELAGHIATYGVWLLGSPAWRNLVFVSRAAVEQKRARIIRRGGVLAAIWTDLSIPYRLSWLTRIRRDLQRFALLVGKKTVPCTPGLDLIWRGHLAPFVEFRRLLRTAKAEACLSALDQLERFVELEAPHAWIARQERVLAQQRLARREVVHLPCPVNLYGRVLDAVSVGDIERWTRFVAARIQQPEHSRARVEAERAWMQGK